MQSTFIQINDIHERKKLPIIVGGTNYYIEAVLWNVLVEPDSVDTSSAYLFSQDSSKMATLPTSLMDITDDILTVDNIFEQPIFADSFKYVSSAHLHNILQSIDPVAAQLFHPNNKRRIIRALQVCQGGRKYSDLIEQQKKEDGGSSLGGPLRFKNTLIFWLNCDKEGKKHLCLLVCTFSACQSLISVSYASIVQQFWISGSISASTP